MPVAEITIDIALVRAMLAEQHPDLANLPITPLAHGWDNEMFRLGPDLVARLPRRAVAEALILHERRWLGALAPALPLAVPAHVRDGRAGAPDSLPRCTCRRRPTPHSTRIGARRLPPAPNGSPTA